MSGAPVGDLISPSTLDTSVAPAAAVPGGAGLPIAEGKGKGSKIKKTKEDKNIKKAEKKRSKELRKEQRALELIMQNPQLLTRLRSHEQSDAAFATDRAMRLVRDDSEEQGLVHEHDDDDDDDDDDTGADMLHMRDSDADEVPGSPVEAVYENPYLTSPPALPAVQAAHAMLAAEAAAAEAAAGEGGKKKKDGKKDKDGKGKEGKDKGKGKGKGKGGKDKDEGNGNGNGKKDKDGKGKDKDKKNKAAAAAADDEEDAVLSKEAKKAKKEAKKAKRMQVLVYDPVLGYQFLPAAVAPADAAAAAAAGAAGAQAQAGSSADVEPAPGPDDEVTVDAEANDPEGVDSSPSGVRAPLGGLVGGRVGGAEWLARQRELAASGAINKRFESDDNDDDDDVAVQSDNDEDEDDDEDDEGDSEDGEGGSGGDSGGDKGSKKKGKKSKKEKKKDKKKKKEKRQEKKREKKLAKVTAANAALSRLLDSPAGAAEVEESGGTLVSTNTVANANSNPLPAPTPNATFVPLSSKAVDEEKINNCDEDGDNEPHAEAPRRNTLSLLPGQVSITRFSSKAKCNMAYERELAKLQIELVKLQAWVKHKGLKVVALFEGRDAAGKGGVIKRIIEKLNPRICRVVALGTPTERERTQWYFQRYVSQLPAAGEVVLFDRSWYNRGGVERVMGFCSDEEHREFMHSCPIFEEMLIRSGVLLLKYWFSVSDDVQEKRFQSRMDDSTKRWKLSPMDIESRNRWVEYSKAKDDMLKHTDTDTAPWVHVHADNKKLARLNCISHFLSSIPYQDLTPRASILPPRKHCQDYVRPPMAAMKWVPDKFV